MSESLLNLVIIAKMNTSLRFMNALESLISQEYSSVAVTVADINEQDSDYSLGLQEDISLYKNIGYIKIDSTSSMAKIRNYMLGCLEGEYIAFLTANDTWDILAAKTVIKEFEENPDLSAVCMNGTLTDERRANISKELLMDNEEKDYIKSLLYNPVLIPAQVIYKTEDIRKIGGFDEELECLCDADMVLRLSKKNGVLIKPDLLCECRLTESFRDYEWKMFLELKKLRLKFIDIYLTDRDATEEFYKKMIRLARINYMWLDLILYGVLYFIFSPLKSISGILKKVGRFVRYIILWLRREFSIFRDIIRIKHNIRYHKTKRVKRHLHGNGDEAIDINFVSAKEYNRKSPLEYAFNKRIRTVKIPDHVTVIKKGMFYGCEGLVSVEIPDSVTRIEVHAFHNCVNLRSIKFGENSRLGIIGSFAFTGCIMLEEINLPPVTEIGPYVFAQCHSLKELRFDNSPYFSSGIERLPRYAFAGCKKLSSVEFDGNSLLEIIEKKAFYGCTNLRKILVTGRLKKVGDYAFACCTGLESVAIINIDTIESIGKGAFMHCKKLPYFQFPSDIKRIGTRTFYGCLRLKSVKIPKKILSINHQAFAKCPMLSNAVILSGDVMISAKAFDRHTKIQIIERMDNGKKNEQG